jgi:GT2 family glycosyltransferase
MDSAVRNLEAPLTARPVLDDISVVIPTLGRTILESCLRWIADGTAWPARVIVVDQGSRSVVEGWLDVLQAAGLQTLYIRSSQTGRSAGLNRGLERVDTRFVTMIDDDCFVKPDWIGQMAMRLRADPQTIVTGRVDHAGSQSAFSVVTYDMPRRYTRPQLKHHPFIGGNVGLAMDLVDRIGFFDEHPCVSSAEDSDYGYRALKLGIPIVYVPNVSVLHYHWRDAEQRASRYADYAYSQGGFYGTHLRHGDPLILMQVVRALLRSPIRWGRGIIRRDEDLAANGRAHTVHLVRGILAGLRRKDA